MQAAAAPHVSPDGLWYWDGRLWQSAGMASARWGWDGRGWVPLGGEQPRPRPTPGNLPVSRLIALVALDLVGFVPGAFLASLVAAAVLLAIDPRGLLTLNGFIKWRRMRFRLRVLAGLLVIALFQFLVLAYLAQRLYQMASAGFGRAPVDRPSPIPSVERAIESPPGDADAIQPALDSLLSQARNQLPQELLEKVRAVVSAIGDVLPAYRASSLGQDDRFVIERTALDYLPSAVQSYLRLPSAYRSVPLSDADGKTASQVLSDQLDLLIKRMRQAADTAYRKDLEALLVHGRFLHSKFGRSSLSLDS
jgi:hypothetical protein